MVGEKPKNWFTRVKGLVLVQAAVTILIVFLGLGWKLIRPEWGALMCLLSIILLYLTLRDIRHLKQVEEEQLVMLSSLGEGVVVLDLQNRVKHLNKTAEQLLGWKEAEAVGKPWDEVAPLVSENGEVLKNYSRATLVVTKTGKIQSNNQNSYRDKQGKVFPVGTTAAPLYLENKIAGSIAVFRDITHDKAIDKAKSEFVSLASHQLRTPLSAIKWFTEMLLSGDAGKVSGEQKEFLQNIYESNQRMIELVNGLLNISRIESGRIIVDPKPTDLKKLVEQVIVDLTSQIKEKQIRMVMSIHPNLPLINIDPKLVSQVVMNLLTNAIKYTPKEGRIEVVISTKENEAVFRITDNGIGIPQEAQAKVFERFYRAGNAVKTVPDGTGLGLYLAKTIVESSGGKMWFKSDEGTGTSFWFSLPLSGMQPKAGEVVLS